MLLHISLVLVGVGMIEAFPRPEGPGAGPRQFVYIPGERQQYNLPFDLGLLQPQLHQVPSYGFGGAKQNYPRVQTQFFLYPGGGAPGQPFLLQPGSPPGNFLVPQPGQGPNVVLRDVPQRPLFVAGYPKPAHIPPIERDAEEIPTTPSKIPPLNNRGVPRKPEKLETFNEDEASQKYPTGKPIIAPNLQPGQRFFILNGQPLFSNYPYRNNVEQNQENNAAIENLLVRNAVTGQIDDIAAYQRPQYQQQYPENLVLLNQPSEGGQGDVVFRSSVPLEINQDNQPIQDNKEIKNEEPNSFALFRLNSDQEDQDNEAIVVEAREQEQDESVNSESDSEVVSVPEKSAEPTIAQAQPGAIALAGPGGVAAAAPRGTAFVGKDGVAVSSPQATAVAGTSKSENNKKPTNKRRQ